jgi:hypothetical protein
MKIIIRPFPWFALFLGTFSQRCGQSTCSCAPLRRAAPCSTHEESEFCLAAQRLVAHAVILAPSSDSAAFATRRSATTATANHTEHTCLVHAAFKTQPPRDSLTPLPAAQRLPLASLTRAILPCSLLRPALSLPVTSALPHLRQ